MDTYLQLHRALRLFQERNRFVSDAQGTGLSLLESRLITDVSNHDSVTLSELCANVGLPPVVVSRAIAGLKDARLVKVTSDRIDRRRRFIQLTAQGKDALADVDHRADKRLDEFVAHLSKDEFHRISRYMSIFADGLGVSPQTYERREHSLRRYIRRITQGLGLLTNKVYQCDDLSSIEWHILAKLGEQSQSILAKTIVLAFCMPPNTVAGIMQRLVKRKLIVRKADVRDRRQLMLGLTAKGRSVLTEVESAATKRLRQALRLLSEDEVHDFTRLLTVMIGARAPILLSPDGEELECVEFLEPDEKCGVRAFCATHLVRRGRAELIDASFYAENSRCFTLRHAGELFACAEIRHDSKDSTRFVATHLASVRSLDDLPMMEQFLGCIAGLLSTNGTPSRVAVAAEWLQTDAKVAPGIEVIH